MKKVDGVYFLDALSVPEDRLNIDGMRNENRPASLNRNQNYRGRGSTRASSKNNFSGTGGRNNNGRRNDDVSRRNINDENNASGAGSTVSKSSTFGVPSSNPPSTSNKSGRSNSRGRVRGFYLHDDRFNRRGDKNEFKGEQFLGYHYLKTLSEKPPHEAICEILRPKAKITAVLSRKELQADWIMLIMDTVRKLCESDFKSSRVQILQYFCESPLLDHVSHYLGEIAMEKNESTAENLNSFVSNLVVFYSAVISIIPTVAVDKNFDRFLTKTKIAIDQMKMYLNKQIDETTIEKLASLEDVFKVETDIRQKIVQNPRRRYLDLMENLPPPDDFRELSLYPTEEDLNRQDFGFVRPNKIKGAYEDVNHYLDVQFRLIREDFIDPIRRGLRDYKNAIALHGKPKYKYEGVRLYPNSRIKNIKVTDQNQVAYVVDFNTNRRLKIKWEYSKRFMFGSLLIFSRDNFVSFFFATVINRDLENLKIGRVSVTLIESKPLAQEMFNQPIVMAESEVFFDPYFLVMKALKEYNEFDFPMKKFIVDGDTTVDVPQYIKDLEVFNIYGTSVNVAANEGWPLHSAIGFDEHQFNAFKTALTSNFTVIQGPPGTGKTYLGLKIVEVLLNNIRRNPDIFKTPILLVCYTNHALDQFLEGILKFTNKIVRVGGQSKSEALIPYNLRGRCNLKSLRAKAEYLYPDLEPALNHCRGRIRTILKLLQEYSREKKMIQIPQGIISHRILSEVMDEEFKQMLYDDETLFWWLLDTNGDLPVFQNKPAKEVEKNVDETPTEPVQVINEKAYVEEDETPEANVLIDEDDLFSVQKIDLNDTTNIYCVTIRELEVEFSETQQSLENLEENKSNFHDYAEYYNIKYMLNENLRVIRLQYNILNHYLQNAELESSATDDVRGQNLWDLPLDLRWRIYWTWLTQLKLIYVNKLKNLEVEFRTMSQQYEELRQFEDFYIVKSCSVVGMTTTCAARLQLLLNSLNPAIVIVEEAAEVLEAHILVSLTKNCEHVILIGDHKQLKPSSAVYELSKKYNINVSLFERMINNNMYCPQLQIQHRMRPEISSLIVPSIYPHLKNHKSVLKFPSVRGITKNLFFIDHNVHEEYVDDSSSRKNEFEAEFMIQLCRYLLLQGYESDQITILTTYSGQMFLLREMKGQNENSIMKEIKVVVVDKYQGEENDIVLLSLVRSNEERKIGFLSIENRVCVALSRAKIGLYIIGNMDILSDSRLWQNIKEELVKQEAIGPKLTLYCEKHDVHTEVSCKTDFVNVLEGGCYNYCDAILKCGHKCPYLCHKINTKHEQMMCRDKCLKQCAENHPCRRYCFQECGGCPELVERSLPCGHNATLPCSQDYRRHLCEVELDVVLKHCSHEVKKKCHESIDSVRCTFRCDDRLACGHKCLRMCHKTDDPDHLKYICKKPCEKKNRECSMDHKCEKLCYEACGKCNVSIEFNLECGHSILSECSTSIDQVKCRALCNKKCTDCNATCQKYCFEDWQPCSNPVIKTIPDCGHERKIECSVVPERKLCLGKCQRVAPCGHKCKSYCAKECGTDLCKVIVKSACVQALCGHGYANVPCWRKSAVIDAEELLQCCTEPCNEILKCGHLCTGTCGSCWQGRFHKACEQKCAKVLICGHSCTFPCRNVCPPCTQKCKYKCRHFECSRDCGELCAPCTKNCEWRCRHFQCTKKCADICDRQPCYEPCAKKLPCNHDCIGFCGEPCPQKCRICDKDEVENIIFGDEYQDDARFVLLEDCGHFIESKAMDKYIYMPVEKGEIVMKSCPVCKTLISKTLRYMNQVKIAYRNIQNVKRKIYSEDEEMMEIGRELWHKLQNLLLRSQQLKSSHVPDNLLLTVVSYTNELRMRFEQSYLSKQALRNMRFLVDLFSSIVSRLNDLTKCSANEKSRVLNKLHFILKRLDPKTLLVNSQLVHDACRELIKCHWLVDYGMYSNNPEFLKNRESPNVKNIAADIVDILHGLKCCDNEQDARIGMLFEKLREEMKTELVLQDEKRMNCETIAKGFFGGVNSEGRWFICAKGYYYCNFDCGGAIQDTKCPECDGQIAGREHRYVENALLLSERDRAVTLARSAPPNRGRKRRSKNFYFH